MQKHTTRQPAGTCKHHPSTSHHTCTSLTTHASRQGQLAHNTATLIGETSCHACTPTPAGGDLQNMILLGNTVSMQGTRHCMCDIHADKARRDNHGSQQHHGASTTQHAVSTARQPSQGGAHANRGQQHRTQTVPKGAHSDCSALLALLATVGLKTRGSNHAHMPRHQHLAPWLLATQADTA